MVGVGVGLRLGWGRGGGEVEWGSAIRIESKNIKVFEARHYVPALLGINMPKLSD